MYADADVLLTCGAADCILQYDTTATARSGNNNRPVYNLCVKAQRRTTFTDLDRIYYATFNVSPAPSLHRFPCLQHRP